MTDFIQARLLSVQGKQDEARELFNRYPDNPEAILGVVVSYLREEKYDDVLKYVDNLKNPPIEAVYNCVTACIQDGKLEEGLTRLYKLVSLPISTFDVPYLRAVELGTTHKRHELILAGASKLVEKYPDNVSYCTAAGRAASELRRHKLGIMYYQKALESCTDAESRGILLAGIGGLYKESAQTAEGVKKYLESFKTFPNTNALSNGIMTAQYEISYDLPKMYELTNLWNTHFAQPELCSPLQTIQAKDTLRIGFVSGDFCSHSLAALILDVFKAFKKLSKNEIYIYYNRDYEDSTTQIYKDNCTVFTDIHDLKDCEVIELIQSHKIDILVDIAGHTALNRLPVFARKPAPVQVGYISGMMTPPGISGIDYFITDKYLKSVRADTICKEMLFPIDCGFCYVPVTKPVALKGNPYLRKDHITFGSFNNPCKLNEEVISTWSKVLKGVPHSRMHVKIYNSATEERLKILFAQNGIGPDRTTYIYELPNTSDVQKYYADEIDIVLDTWPCSGCLTSAEAMYMGVPVVTYVGDGFLQRQTWSILNQIGLADLGATTLDGFVKCATNLANNKPYLKELRQTLRMKIENSLLYNPEHVAIQLMETFSKIWDTAISRQSVLNKYSIFKTL
jgi:predicted O-linked N-acetylglucosamine transferase (SPINDLY family)